MFPLNFFYCLNFNLDYDKPVLKKRDQVEFGIAYNYRKNNNDLVVQNLNYSTQAYIIDNKLTNNFFYNENILSAYASYNFRKNGWGIKSGLRAEYTNVNFDLSTGAKNNVNQYLILFPKILKKNGIKEVLSFYYLMVVKLNNMSQIMVLMNILKNLHQVFFQNIILIIKKAI